MIYTKESRLGEIFGFCLQTVGHRSPHQCGGQRAGFFVAHLRTGPVTVLSGAKPVPSIPNWGQTSVLGTNLAVFSSGWVGGWAAFGLLRQGCVCVCVCSDEVAEAFGDGSEAAALVS